MPSGCGRNGPRRSVLLYVKIWDERISYLRRFLTALTPLSLKWTQLIRPDRITRSRSKLTLVSGNSFRGNEIEPRAPNTQTFMLTDSARAMSARLIPTQSAHSSHVINRHWKRPPLSEIVVQKPVDQSSLQSMFVCPLKPAISTIQVYSVGRVRANEHWRTGRAFFYLWLN